MKTTFLLLSFFVFFLSSAPCFGHARLRVSLSDGSVPRLIPRNISDANKGGDSPESLPCGSASLERGNNPVVLVVGETVPVEIEETINHVGRFLVNFSPAAERDFISLIDREDPNVPISSGMPQRYTESFVVPNSPCTDCIIQFVQVMEPNTAYYKACVDVIVTTPEEPPPAKPSGFVVTK